MINAPYRRPSAGGTMALRKLALVPVLLASVLLASLLLIVLPAQSQEPSFLRQKGIVVHQYAVKFVCGKPRKRELAPGIYSTAINIHNPDLFKEVNIWAKVAVALPGPEVGPVTWIPTLGLLKPDHALEIDCSIIRKYARDNFKGFVVIFTIGPIELDVVAVYTADRGEGVESLHMERVPQRLMKL